MDIYLDFLSSKDIITILLLLYKEGEISRVKLAKMLNVSKQALYKKIKLLRDNMLIHTSEKVSLTPRGRFIATYLTNMNYYLSGGKSKTIGE